MPKIFSESKGVTPRNSATGSSQVAMPGRRDPVVWLIACGVLLVAGIVLGTMMMVGEFRERALANSERELENTVLLLTRHFDQQFADYQILNSDLISRLDDTEFESPEAFKERMFGVAAYERLKAQINALSYVDDVNIYDSDGELINTSSAWPPPAIDLSDRQYFQIFKTDPQSPPFFAEAQLSPAIGKWTTVLAHRLTGADGTFLGVMTRRIAPANYEKFFATLALGENTAIALLHADGTMLAHYPHVDDMVGQQLNDVPSMKEIVSAGRPQTIRYQSPVDGQDRLGAVRQLSNFPIVVVTTRTVAAALSDWRAQTRLLIATAAMSAAVIALILFLIVRQIIRQNRETQNRLEAERQRLDTALNNMTQGLVLYDASARLVMCNRRYIEMYRLSTHVVKPGCRFLDMIQHRKETGSFDGSIEDYCSQVLDNIRKGKINRIISESGNGRAYQIVNKPLAQGGWIATIEDITERRKLEQERDRNHAFLREIIDHIPSQITVKDVSDRRYLLVNRVTEQQFGFSSEVIVGKTAFELFPEASAEEITADDDQSLQLPGGLFLDERPSQSQALGQRYITSRRIAIRDQVDAPRYIVNVVEDVTERRQANDKIAHLAHYDALTDLPNRVLFREQIERELQKATEGQSFALLYIDIDEFKGINDSLGHHVGDELLKSVAARIKGCLNENDLIARLGGDEFAVIRTQISGKHDVEAFIRRIHEAIRQPYLCLGHQLSSDASIGIALAPQDGTDLDQLIRSADLAMYAAKAGGRRVHRYFERSMDACAKARLAMEQDLRRAIADGCFQLHYQPLVDLRHHTVTGCEALLRWHHPERGMISPAEFIPVAEDTGLINELGDWVLKTACAEAATWPEHIRIAVNVSPVQLKSPTLALRISAALAATGLSPRRLEIEITEAVLIRDDEAALTILHQLRAIGVRIALDDFGTGYSSLSYLKRFPFDKIKIDRSFIADMIEVAGSSSIVQAIVSIAAALKMTTTAEGVETEAQRELLRQLGCTDMQGYLFSRPIPAAEVRELFDHPPQKALASA
jgi:diguanylate cyclase (GGDEF)-like protein/PAS domain S-box-containing protein